MKRSSVAIVLALTALCTASAPAQDRPSAGSAAEGSGRVLVRVNGKPITEGELEFLMVARRIPPEKRPELRKPFLDQLVDRRLMQAFLAERKAAASDLDLDAELRRIRELIQRSGESPEAVLARLGYTEQTLRDELELPLAWRSYTRLLITPNRLREYFAKHQRRFDGTEVRASQVFLTARTPAERDAALETLKTVRERITSGELSFADAARKYSQAPTAAAGGDVGWFPYRGKMPAGFSQIAFELGSGKVSEPFATAFGVHLVTVTAENPGDLSLEDVRRDVFAAFAGELWDEIVAKQRSAAQIEWSDELDKIPAA